MGFSRTDGKYIIYIIKHLYKDKPGDWGDSGDCCHWIPKKIIREKHDELVYNGIFKSFTANGRCWQTTGIHGSFIKRDAIRILDKISEWNPQHRFKVCRLRLNQVTEDVYEKKYATVP